MKTGLKGRRPFLTILACNLFLVLTVAFFLPLEVVMGNVKEFYVPFANLWWFQLLLSLGAALVLTGIMTILPGRAGVTAAGLSLALGVAAYAQAMFLNGGMVALTGDEMTVTEGEITRNLVIWGVIIAAVLLAVILFSGRHRRGTEIAMRAVAAALAAVQAVGFITSAFTLDLSPKKQELALTTESQFELGNEENVIVFVLDTADGSYAAEMLERYPELNESLAGWTWYPDATSHYSRTYPGLPYMLTGAENHMDRPVAEFLDEAYGNSAFLPGLSGAGVDCRVLTWDAFMVSEKAEDAIANMINYRYESFSSLNLPGLEKSVMKIALYKCLPYRFKEVFSYEMADINTESYYEQDDTYLFYSYMDDEFFCELEYGVTVPGTFGKTFRLFHLFGTHAGVRWDENLEEIPPEEKTGEDYPAALRGCFRNVECMIEQMKELGIYDRATIIVTADHGIPGSIPEGEEPVLKSPSTILMMVKLPGSDLSQPLRTDLAPVSQDEIFATVENALGVPVSGTGSGKTFADFREGDARERYYNHTYLHSHKSGEIALVEYLITGDARDIANWKQTGNWWDILYSTNAVSAEPYP